MAQDLKDKDQINNIMRELDKDNAKKKMEIEQRRQQIREKIAQCDNDDGEKQRLLNQLNAYEDTVRGQMKNETEA